MGCFWAPQERLLKLEGVLDVKVGYSGGNRANPSYQEVCSGSTNHYETVRVEYDNDVISYEELLQIFFEADGLVKDAGQYSAVIFTHDDIQQQIVQQKLKQVDPQLASIPIVKEADTFYVAERYHDNFWKKQKLRNGILVLPIVSQFLPLSISSLIPSQLKAIFAIIPVLYVVLFVYERFLEPRDAALSP